MKIRRIEAINLNTILADLTISGEEIKKDLRMNIIKTKLQLSQLSQIFEQHREETTKECDGDDQIFKELIEEYLLEPIDIKIYSISEQDFNSLLDINSLKTNIAELLYKLLVDHKDDGSSITCSN